MSKKQISTVLITILLMGIGLSSELSKDIAVKVYCNIQPHDCKE